MGVGRGGGGWGREGSCHGITKYNSPFHGSQNATLRFHDSRKFKNYKCRNDIKFEEKTRWNSMLLQIADLDISSTFRERSLFMSGGGGWLKNFKISIFFGSPPPPKWQQNISGPPLPPKKIITEDLTDECFCLKNTAVCVKIINIWTLSCKQINIIINA